MKRDTEARLVFESDGLDTYIQIRIADEMMCAFRIPPAERFHKHLVVDVSAKMKARAERIRRKAEREND